MSLITALKPLFQIVHTLKATEDTYLKNLTTEQKSKVIACSIFFQAHGFEQEASHLSDLINRLSNDYLPEAEEFINLFKCCLNKCSHQELYQMLNLDQWQTEGDKERACELILGNLLNQGLDLDLTNLNLTSLPECLFSDRFNFRCLNCSHNRIGRIPELISKKGPFIFDLSNNIEFNQELDFIFKFHHDTSVHFEWTMIPLKNRLSFHRKMVELSEQNSSISIINYSKIHFSNTERKNPTEISADFFNDLNIQPPLNSEYLFLFSVYRQSVELATLLLHCLIFPQIFREPICKKVASALHLACRERTFREALYKRVLISRINYFSHPILIITTLLKLQLEWDIFHASGDSLESERIFNVGLFLQILNDYENHSTFSIKKYKALILSFLETDLILDHDLIAYITSFNQVEKLDLLETEEVSTLLEKYNTYNLIDFIIYDEYLFNLFLRTLTDSNLIQYLTTLHLEILKDIKHWLKFQSFQETLNSNQNFNQLRAEMRKTWLIATCENN